MTLEVGDFALGGGYVDELLDIKLETLGVETQSNGLYPLHRHGEQISQGGGLEPFFNHIKKIGKQTFGPNRFRCNAH